MSKILRVDPPDSLVFKGPFSEVFTASITLNNPTDEKIGFVVKTTAPKGYLVRPNHGIINPHKEIVIAVKLQPTDHSKDKLMVQYMCLEEDISIDDIHDAIKAAGRSKLMDTKLKCIFTNGNSMSDTDQKKDDVDLTVENALLEGRIKELQKRNDHLTAMLEKKPYLWAIQEDEIKMMDVILQTREWGEVKLGNLRGTQVAVRCLQKVTLSDRLLPIFSREMDIASHVHHPNLVQFIGATRVGNPIIITEYIPTNLLQELEKTSLKYNEMLSISHGIASALTYLHLWKPEPITHKCICSANVLLERVDGGNWKAKLSDYGSANFLHQISIPDSYVQQYLAPDTYGLSPPEMNVFSFGILLAEMSVSAIPESTEWLSIKKIAEACVVHDSKYRPTMEQILQDITQCKLAV